MSDQLNAGLKALTQRAKVADIVILVTMAAFGLVLIGEVLEFAGVIDLNAYTFDALTTAYVGISLLSFVIFIGSVIVICMWIHQAHSNLQAGGIELETSPGWAVGWYFIPIANLFKPFQAMRELWNESHGASDSYAAEAPSTLGVWWGCWIIGNILGNISTRMSMMGDGSNLQVALVISIASSVITIASAWLLRGIIMEITAAQSRGISLAQVFD